AVEAVVVFNNVLVSFPINLRVVPGDGKIVHVDQVVWQTADGDHALRERDLLQNSLLKLQIEFCHFKPPEKNLVSMFSYQGRSACSRVISPRRTCSMTSE